MGGLAIVGEIIAAVGIAIVMASVGITIVSAFPGQQQTFSALQFLNITDNGASPVVTGIVIAFVGALIAAFDGFLSGRGR